ncbi:MAG: DUF6153 family protein [Pseudonocardiales bacterium]|jgi:hypothetical protein|nr:DUF6153 family protein [Pseudonocardiales bacterium]
MVTTSTAALRRALLLAGLVAVLFVGLVGMHHMATGSSCAAPHGGSAPSVMVAELPVADDDGAHPCGDRSNEGHTVSLLHLCLAVLTAIAVVAALLLAWMTRIREVRRPAEGRSAPPRTGPRAPPPSAPARLALLCVLRT